MRLAVEVWQVDMSSGSSVRDFCARVERELPRLDSLVLNAGVAIGAFVECEGGWESSVAINVIGTFLMAVLCLPIMRRTAAQHNVAPTIAVVASEAHVFASFAERKRQGLIFDAFKSAADMNEDRYNVTKLLDVLLARELAARLGPDSPVVVNQRAEPGPVPVRAVPPLSLSAQRPPTPRPHDPGPQDRGRLQDAGGRGGGRARDPRKVHGLV